MQHEVLMTDIMKEIENRFMKYDIELVREFIQHKSQRLAIEFICDKIIEYHLPGPFV